MLPISGRPRVLVADDHSEITKAICRLLELDCDIVGTVADGVAVLEAAQRLQPDVIVMDLNLPAVSGLEACRRITQANPGARVIMFTATDDPNLTQYLTPEGFLRLSPKTAGTDGFFVAVLEKSR